MSNSDKSFDGKEPSKNHSANGKTYGKISEDMFTTRSVPDVTSALEPQKVIVGLYKFKWFILLMTIIGGIAAWFYSESETRLYRTTGTILMYAESGVPYYSGGDIGSMLTRNLGLASRRPIENQIEMLRSRTFTEDVARELIARQTMSNNERFPILGEPGSRVYVDRIANIIRSRTQVNRLSRDLNIISVTHFSSDPFEAMEICNLIKDTYIAINDAQNRESIRSTITYLEDIMLEEVEERLAESERRVEEFMRTVDGGLNLTAHTNRVINEMANLEREVEILEIEKEAVISRQNNIESELEQIRPGFVNQLKLATGARIEILQENIAALSVERMLMINRNPELRNNEEMEPRLREINREIDIYRTEIDDLINDILVDESSGFLVSESGSIANQRFVELRRELLQNIVEIERTNALVNLYNVRLIQNENKLESLPAEMTRFARLERNRILNQQMYTDLASRQIELALLEQSTAGSGRVFDYAQLPSAPFYPRVNFILMLGLMMGFAVSAGLVVLFVLVNKKIDSIDIMKQYDLPVMAIVPEMNSLIKDQFKGNQFYEVDGKKVSTSLVTLFDSISNVSEAYRRLYNNIKYNNPDSSNKVFLVTSPSKGEGKSTCASNLAIAMAESGKKVLLVDCDFRRPRLHRMFDLTKDFGITNYLFDDVPVDSLIQETLAANLYLLTAGPKPNSPGLATNSDKMAALVDELSQKFDYLIIDTPPFGIITDAAPLIRLADGVIALARFNLTITPELDQLIENLRSVRAEITGTVLMDYSPDIASGYYTYNRMYAYNYSVYKAYHKSDEPEKV